MTRSITLLTVACLAIPSTAAQASVALAPAGDGHLSIPAYVNDLGPFPFILDTGADESGVYLWFAKQQKLPAGKMQELGGQTGTTTAPTYHVGRLSVDGRAITNAPVDGFPDRHDAGRQAGVAGNDVMDGTVTVFDFPCGTIQIHAKPVDLAAILPKDAVQVEGGPVLDGTQLTLPVTISGVRGVAVLDTGSRDTRINTLFAKAAGIDPASPAFKDGDLIYGANSKPVTSRKGPVGPIQFAGITIERADVRVMDLWVFGSMGLGNGPAMILGMDLMKDHELIYDHEAKRFWFGRSACRQQAR
jgi:hypothetical protein